MSDNEFDKIKKIKQMADLVLLHEDQKFNVADLAGRFASVEDKYRHDMVIRNVGGAIEIMAKRNPDLMVSAGEISAMYNHFSGLQPDNQFKQAMGDLLSGQSVESNRVAEEEFVVKNRQTFTDGVRDLQAAQAEIEIDEDEAALDEPVPIIGIQRFDPEELRANTRHDKKLIAEGAKLVATQLQSLGCQGAKAQLKYAVSKCLLYLASFPVPQGHVYVNIPIEVTEDKELQIPSVIADRAGRKLYAFSNDGVNELLYTEMEARENAQVEAADAIRQNITTADRSPRSEDIEVDETEAYVADQSPVKMPEELVDIEAVLQNAVSRKESGYTQEAINSSRTVVASELAKLGYKNIDIRFAGDNEQGMQFDATLLTIKGKMDITVPVQLVQGNILFPTKFAADDGEIHELNSQEITSLLEKPEVVDPVRYSASLVDMSYNSLRKIVHSAVFDRKLNIAQEALALIKDKFGADHHNNAVADFDMWLKEAGQDYSKRCNGCPFYRVAGAKNSTHSKDWCGLLNEGCNNVVKKANVCTRSTINWDSVRDDSYKGIITGHDIRLS